jgi:hypothetical protein
MTITADGKGERALEPHKLARYDLIPPEILEALAVHYGRGAMKYADRNWERGMSWCTMFACGMRHAWKWFRGESYDKPDPRMGGYRAHHLVSAVWNLANAYVYEVRAVGDDDRPQHAVAAPHIVNDEPISVEWCIPPVPEKHFTYWYLGTPYTKFPAGLDAAHVLASRLTADLLKLGVPVYSPIAHTHPVAVHGEMDKVDHEIWVKADKPLLEAAGGLIVVMAESWERSRGLAHEIAEFRASGKPIVYWDPAAGVPQELRFGF